MEVHGRRSSLRLHRRHHRIRAQEEGRGEEEAALYAYGILALLVQVLAVEAQIPVLAKTNPQTTNCPAPRQRSRRTLEAAPRAHCRKASRG